MENNTAVNGNIGPDQIIADANNLISRIERIKKVDPCEIASLQVFAINYISKICAVVSCGITETVPKAYVHLATQLWIDRERYLNTRDFRTQRIFDEPASIEAGIEQQECAPSNHGFGLACIRSKKQIQGWCG